MQANDIISNFVLNGKAVEVEPLGEGFINDTFIVKTDTGVRYILQRKNHHVFPDVPAMMDNIVSVTRHIKKKVADPDRETLTIVPTVAGRFCCQDKDGNFWAVCTFIEGSKTYAIADTLELARQGGIGIGRFNALLSDFKEPLAEVIKGFHNIRWRFIQWDEALKRDAAGRVKDLAEEISWIEARRGQMLSFWSKVENGEIPTRVTHNDTKLSNILFNASDDSVLCAIDLDTVMSSTILNDVGDAIRSYANATVEDDPDYSKVGIRLDVFKAYMEGYLSEMGAYLTDSEKENLAFGPLYITYEQVLRFLMDYIDGDTYYRIHYPDHNLVRTRSQYALLKSMEDNYSAMKKIVCDVLDD